MVRSITAFFSCIGLWPGYVEHVLWCESRALGKTPSKVEELFLKSLALKKASSRTSSLYFISRKFWWESCFSLRLGFIGSHGLFFCAVVEVCLECSEYEL